MQLYIRDRRRTTMVMFTLETNFIPAKKVQRKEEITLTRI